MRIAIGSDHGGFELKQTILSFLHEMGTEAVDFGTYAPEPVDYPDIARSVALAVAKGEFDRGILLCGTGIGMCITANKVPGIRAALCHDVFSAKATRNHNDSNILCMGGRVIGPGLAREIVKTWLAQEFEGGRHKRRVDKIAAVEEEFLASRERDTSGRC
ncbi:MAG TPA: ribose 5-phosphate isomerase B [Firmicutes bacterium]|nr:ribose 5-phosphate isomerase B [Bacillota bacterium]